MKYTVMQHKKGGERDDDYPQDALCGRMYRVTQVRELFHAKHPSPVIVSDYHTLAPIYPHNIRQIPLLEERDRYREDIRQDKRQGRLFKPENGFTHHVIDRQRWTYTLPFTLRLSQR